MGFGLDRLTGKPLSGIAHVRQSVKLILKTAIGSRVMRRNFGSNVPPLLGRSMSEALILRYKTAIIVAIELWEPRLDVLFVHRRSDNNPEQMRTGRFGMTVQYDYMPRGHLGDFTKEGTTREMDV